MNVSKHWKFFTSMVYITWFNFVIRYRKTILGPLWLLVGPLAFIAFVGTLYASIGSSRNEQYFPHLTIGVVVWTLIIGFTNGSATVFIRGRMNLMAAELDIFSVLLIDIIKDFIHFLHQIVLIGIIIWYFNVPVSWSTLVAIPGLILLMINGFWMKMVFGAIGARFTDYPELLQPIMRIAFLSTPIIWMPIGGFGRAEVMGPYLLLNPFYHLLELVRAPLLGNTITNMTWAITISMAVIGTLVAIYVYRKHSTHITLWI